ncbi:hypothetical protein F5Y19DRAFT_470542 [Xylariaceae sp. FL1651]|nr:hypothetical protein F5Y19DRAFT_470542 [Xylariaceae sp. FL1651]
MVDEDYRVVVSGDAFGSIVANDLTSKSASISLPTERDKTWARTATAARSRPSSGSAPTQRHSVAHQQPLVRHFQVLGLPLLARGAEQIVNGHLRIVLVDRGRYAGHLHGADARPESYFHGLFTKSKARCDQYFSQMQSPGNIAEALGEPALPLPPMARSCETSAALTPVFEVSSPLFSLRPATQGPVQQATPLSLNSLADLHSGLEIPVFEFSPIPGQHDPGASWPQPSETTDPSPKNGPSYEASGSGLSDYGTSTAVGSKSVSEPEPEVDLEAELAGEPEAEKYAAVAVLAVCSVLTGI